jgi:hypothetical protein
VFTIVDASTPVVDGSVRVGGRAENYPAADRATALRTNEMITHDTWKAPHDIKQTQHVLWNNADHVRRAVFRPLSSSAIVSSLKSTSSSSSSGKFVRHVDRQSDRSPTPPTDGSTAARSRTVTDLTEVSRSHRRAASLSNIDQK